MSAHALRCGCAGRTTCFTLKFYKMRHPAKVDVAVLMLFFNRPDSLQKVFNEVKKARPAHLFLYQDGPRNENDMEGIMACRHIVEEIDWVCDVHRLYQNRNYGCDPSGFMSQKWAFSNKRRAFHTIIFLPLFFLFGAGLHGEEWSISGTNTTPFLTIRLPFSSLPTS